MNITQPRQDLSPAAADASSHFQAGLAAHEAGRLDDAFAAYKAALQLDGRHVATLHHLGILGYQIGNYELALEFLGAAIRTDPGLAAAYGNLGDVFAAIGEYASAIESYEQALALGSPASSALCGRGKVLLQLKHHEEALATFNRAIDCAARDASAWQGRASALQALGRLHDARAAYKRAIALDPNDAAALYGQGQVFGLLGRHCDALASYQQAIRREPSHQDACLSLVDTLVRLGRLDEALASCDALLALLPEVAQAHQRRAAVLRLLGRNDEAVASYQQAVIGKPGDAALRLELGHALYALGRCHGALQCFDAALALCPDDPEVHHSRGIALQALKRFDEALASLDLALQLDPTHVNAMLNRGNTLQSLGHIDEALACYDEVLAHRGDDASIWNNRGNALEAAQRSEEAMDCYARAIALAPGFEVAHWNRALLALQQGQLADGWRGYEWRWKNPHLTVYRQKRDFTEPLWLGNAPLEGKTILLHAEQGLGDTLQFCRYVPLVKARGAQVILEVQQPLTGLLAGLDGVDRILSRNDTLPPFDCHCPLMSLPLAFGTELDSIPAPTRYLSADPNRRAQWEARLGPRRRPRIGLAWSGNPDHANDHNRSIRFTQLAPMFAIDCQFVSLQKEYRARDLATLDASGVLRFEAQLDDFADTAALCELMDVVITVDTSVAHLAGALGRPLWLMLPEVADWRWLTGRSNSPWYPSARLFRQPAHGDWASVVGALARELGALPAP